MTISPNQNIQILPFASIVNLNANGIVITGADPTLALDLNFLSSGSDSLYTFARASSATDVINGVLTTFASGVRRRSNSNGLLIEESRTNLAQNSTRTPGNATWAAANQIGPDGIANSAGTLTIDGAANNHFLTANSITYTAATRTVSAFVKTISGSARIQLGFGGAASGAYANFSLTGSGSVLASGAGASNPLIQQLSNGWYRISLTATTIATTAVAAALFFIDSDTALRGPSFTGNGTDAVAVFGFQTELGSFMTSYIATTSASVTRAADEASISPISWFNASTGTFVVEARTGFALPSATVRLMRVRDAAATNFSEINYNTGGTLTGRINAASVDQAVMNSVGTLAVNTIGKVGIAYALNDMALSLAGAAAVTDVVGTMPTGVDTLRIGASASNAGFFNGYIRRLSYYNVRKSNAELQALTT